VDGWTKARPADQSLADTVCGESARLGTVSVSYTDRSHNHSMTMVRLPMDAIDHWNL
jgi:hypothetical protein